MSQMERKTSCPRSKHLTIGLELVNFITQYKARNEQELHGYRKAGYALLRHGLSEALVFRQYYQKYRNDFPDKFDEERAFLGFILHDIGKLLLIPPGYLNITHQRIRKEDWEAMEPHHLAGELALESFEGKESSQKDDPAYVIICGHHKTIEEKASRNYLQELAFIIDNLVSRMENRARYEKHFPTLETAVIDFKEYCRMKNLRYNENILKKIIDLDPKIQGHLRTNFSR